MSGDLARLAEQYGYRAPVDQLLVLGDLRGGVQHDYAALGLRQEDIHELIRMAGDERLWLADAEDVEVWSSAHAWRALGALRAEAAIGPLVRLLSRPDPEEFDDWIGEDFPDVFAQIGPAAIPALATYLRAPGHGVWARTTASSALEKIAAAFPDTRASVVTILDGVLADTAGRARPASENERILNGSIIADLIHLRAVESAPTIERAFAAGRVDESMAGDLEDVQIALGLRQTRETPARNYALESLRAKGIRLPPLLGGDLYMDDEDNPDEDSAPIQTGDLSRSFASPPTSAPQRAAAERKAKNKRAMAKQSRRQNRKRK